MIQRLIPKEHNSFKKISQLESLRALEAGFLWADTAWSTLKNARNSFPNEIYRKIKLSKYNI